MTERVISAVADWIRAGKDPNLSDDQFIAVTEKLIEYFREDYPSKYRELYQETEN